MRSATAPASAIRSSTRARASLIDERPPAQPIVVEGEVGDVDAELRQLLGDSVLAVVSAVEEHVPSPAGPGDLAAERPLSHGRRGRVHALLLPIRPQAPNRRGA